MSSCFIKNVIKDSNFFFIFILGIISGMPFAIMTTSLITWFTESGIALSIVTLFAIARIPYSLKIFWSPLVDSFRLPLLTNFIKGKRKSWMILANIASILLLIIMSMLNPIKNINIFLVVSILFGICAATYDMAYDAWRIEILDTMQQALGAATATFGFRIGCLITGAGALYSAALIGWNNTFLVFAMLFLIGLVFVFFFITESKINVLSNFSYKIYFKTITQSLKYLLNRKYASIILLALLLYKLGDAMLATISTPFFLKIGFTKQQIAYVVKVFGIIASISGSYAGGILIAKTGYFLGLLICGIFQAMTNLSYLWLFYQDIEIQNLLIAISIENFTGGMGATALIAYLSCLCNKEFTATQYAMLSSITTLMNNSITMSSGYLVEQMGWKMYFIFTVIISIPALLLIVFLHYKTKNLL